MTKNSNLILKIASEYLRKLFLGFYLRIKGTDKAFKKTTVTVYKRESLH
jgi:hypothetical protein